MKSKFDTLLEKIYTEFENGNKKVMYSAPAENAPYVRDVLKFLESDKTLLWEFINMGNNVDAKHEDIVQFWNKVIARANETGKLKNIPAQVWQDLRDWATCRISKRDANYDFAMEPAWKDIGERPSTFEAFDEEMGLRNDPNNRIPFNAFVQSYQLKGLGKKHMFSMARAKRLQDIKQQQSSDIKQSIPKTA